MKRPACLVIAASGALVVAIFIGGARVSAAAEPKRPAGPVVPGWIERIDKIHEPGYMDWISTAWAAMLLKQGIIPAEDAPKAASVVLELWKFDFAEDEREWHQFYKNQYFFDKRLDKRLAGMMMIGRTQPSGRQMLEVRHHLMKRMCQVCDLQLAMLKLAEEHATTIMPGYTHERHAQPTTFGHYILSGFDAVQRSAETLEHGYHLMSLNEMGCGALAGTSWPIDRDLVSAYLGMEGLVENANDAVGYADGYVVVATGLANVCNALSRMALEMKFWSGVEYGFLEMGSHGKSFMMPQKSTNPNSLEIVGLYAGQVVGHLTAVAIAGLREPHGDTHAMLHLMDPTLAALEAAEKPVTLMHGEMETLQVHPERMLAVIRESYIASTEVANQMARDYGIDYRTAHEVVKQFVLASEKDKIPATEARAGLLDEAAEAVIGKKLGMTDARLRQLLDPAHFIKVTNSKGGVAPEEVARMIADRRQKLAAARARHTGRIETLEKAQARLVADLRAFAEHSAKEPGT